MNDHTQAENHYRQALASAARQSAKFWELRAAMGMARLWRDQGKPKEVRELLAPVYGWFTDGFMAQRGDTALGRDVYRV